MQLDVEINPSANDISISAMAALYAPSVEIRINKIVIEISGYVGGIGGEFQLREGLFTASAAYGYGAGIAIEWE